MTELSSAPFSEMTEEELLAAARDQSEGARAELFARHWDKCVAIAISLVGPNDAEDLAAEAFSRALAQLQRGKGPEVAFRPYIVATLRHLRIDRARKGSDLLIDDFSGTSLEPALADGAEERADAHLIRRAFNSLPERWRLTLWHTAVEGESLGQLAQRLGSNPNSIAQLNFRAREGLRRAYLAEYVAASSSECEPFAELLPKHARDGLSQAQQKSLELHLQKCAPCRLAVGELRQVNAGLGAVLLPAIAGVALTKESDALAGGASGAAAVQAGHAGLVKGLIVTGVVAAGVAGVLLWPGGSEPSPTATPPTTALSKPTSTPTPARAVPTKAPSPKVSEVPSTATPTPSPAASTPPPEPLTLGKATTEKLTSAAGGWAHVSVPVTAPKADLRLLVTGDNLESYELHSDAEFGHWNCRKAGGPLVCLLPAATPGTRSFAIDVLPKKKGPVNLELQLSSGDVVLEPMRVQVP